MMTSNMPLNSKQVLACCEDFSALQVPILLHKNVGLCIKIKKIRWTPTRERKTSKLVPLDPHSTSFGLPTAGTHCPTAILVNIKEEDTS